MRERSLAGFTAGVLLSVAVGASPAITSTVKVSNKNDSGPNTFRAAVEAANNIPSIDRIEFRPGNKDIKLKSPVTYTGVQALTIDGKGATITENGADNLLVANDGGDLHLKTIAFVEALRSGVVVTVPAGNTLREQTVTLDNVTLYGNGWYGLLFDDQIGGDGGGSSFDNNGDQPQLPSDLEDGLDVDEAGDGDIWLSISNSSTSGPGSGRGR